MLWACVDASAGNHGIESATGMPMMIPMPPISPI